MPVITTGAGAPGTDGASPTAATPTEGGTSNSPATGAIAEGNGIRITADPTNNALLISATPSDYRKILSAIKQLDVVPLQVLIEATIAEVTLNDKLKYGLQWFFDSGSSSFTFSSLATGAVSAMFPGFSYVFTGGDNRVILNALSDITNVKVISSPQLMVLNNQSARLQVGDQVPIAVQSAVSTIDPNAPIVNSIEFRDTGVILDVVPRVNAGGLVVLDIAQEVSDVVETTSSTLNSPTIRQRRIASTVAVQSGQTIALGGLIRDSRTDSETGIPLLSDIPYLGNLFKTTSQTSDRTELLILLTPRVVRNSEDSREITEELRRRLHALQPLDEKIE
ncbi:hypothetical protein FRZ44_17380 [Hypericibacter terrae]|uniref:Uncharacterized protein n=2 Tax=Hypericibacter terrae TaxID=2602015 RepID=A0A5J6MIW8_9PROT|nr:hypothetical protein FRZ44_17380 [Hypericibacter terrae]